MFDIFAVLVIAVFILMKLASIRNNTTETGAPYVPLEPEVVERIMKMIKIKEGDVFYDLGSGDGRLVIAAAQRGAMAYGVEFDFFRVWYSRWCIFLLGLSSRAKIIKSNFFEIDLSQADVVTAYLLQETNDKLLPKLERELKVGTRVVGVAFNFLKWKPKMIDPNGPVYGPIYLYQVEEKK